jgi:hypothetical protein
MYLYTKFGGRRQRNWSKISDEIGILPSRVRETDSWLEIGDDEWVPPIREKKRNSVGLAHVLAWLLRALLGRLACGLPACKSACPPRLVG